jgi:hypothetical protein
MLHKTRDSSVSRKLRLSVTFRVTKYKLRYRAMFFLSTAAHLSRQDRCLKLTS